MFDPFGDFETAGYLRNVFAEKRPEVIRGLEHFQFKIGLPAALSYLAEQKNISYNDYLKVHEIIFKPLYPWAGQDRSITAPNIAITKAGYNDLFCHPNECKRAGEYALNLGTQTDVMRQRSGEVLGLLAYSHPFLDGNGRTMMTVHSELCRRAGIQIDWHSTAQQDYLKALTAELQAPEGRHLDNYLKPYVLQQARDIKTLHHELLALKGLNKNVEGQVAPQAVPEKVYPPLFKAVTEFDQKPEAAARENALQDRHVTRANAELQELATHVYKDPETALQKIALQAQTGKEPYQAFHRDHTQYGELRGADSLLKGLKAHQERKEAEAGMVSLANGIKAYEKAYTAAYDRELKAEHDRREAMKVEVVGVSKEALKVLRDVSRMNKMDAVAYRDAIDKIQTDKPKLAEEISRLSSSLNQRFGQNGLSASATNAVQRVSAKEQSRLTRHAKLFSAAQSITNVRQINVQREQQAKITQSQGVEQGIRM